MTIGTEVFIAVDNYVESGNICCVNESWYDYNGFHGEYKAMIPGYKGSHKFEYADFDKTVFLTRTEAEEALKRMKGA